MAASNINITVEQLKEAVGRDESAVILQWLEEKQGSINVPCIIDNSGSETLLQYAGRLGSRSVVEALVGKGAEVKNEFTEVFEQTANQGPKGFFCRAKGKCKAVLFELKEGKEKSQTLKTKNELTTDFIQVSQQLTKFKSDGTNKHPVSGAAAAWTATDGDGFSAKEKIDLVWGVAIGLKDELHLSSEPETIKKSLQTYLVELALLPSRQSNRQMANKLKALKANTYNDEPTVQKLQKTAFNIQNLKAELTPTQSVEIGDLLNAIESSWVNKDVLESVERLDFMLSGVALYDTEKLATKLCDLAGEPQYLGQKIELKNSHLLRNLEFVGFLNEFDSAIDGNTLEDATVKGIFTELQSILEGEAFAVETLSDRLKGLRIQVQNSVKEGFASEKTVSGGYVGGPVAATSRRENQFELEDFIGLDLFGEKENQPEEETKEIREAREKRELETKSNRAKKAVNRSNPPLKRALSLSSLSPIKTSAAGDGNIPGSEAVQTGSTGGQFNPAGILFFPAASRRGTPKGVSVLGQQGGRIAHPNSGVASNVNGGIIGSSGHSSSKLDVRGYSPLYYTLKKVYEHLEEEKGYENISAPMLKMYLDTLTEIKANKDIKFGSQTLWETLNPEGATFKVEQLLEVKGEKSFLQSEIDKHETDYIPRFKILLSREGGRYEPLDKSYYFEKKTDGRIHLVLRTGQDNIFKNEMEEAFMVFSVICQDMSGNVDAPIHIHQDTFSSVPENQKKIAVVVNWLGLELTPDGSGNNAAEQAHTEVRKFSDGMKESRDQPGDERIDEGAFNLKDETLNKGYRLMRAEGLMDAKLYDNDSDTRKEFLNESHDLDSKFSYIPALGILKEVLPETKTNTYKKEKIYVHLKPQEVNGSEFQLLGKESGTRKEKLSELKGKLEKLTADQVNKQEVSPSRTNPTDPVLPSNVGNDLDSELSQVISDSLKTNREENKKRELPWIEGITFKEIPRDGNCFYHAVAAHLNTLDKNQWPAELNGLKSIAPAELHKSLRNLLAEKHSGHANTSQDMDETYLPTFLEKTGLAVAVLHGEHAQDGFQYPYYEAADANRVGDEVDGLRETAKKEEVPKGKTIVYLFLQNTHYTLITEHANFNPKALAPVPNKQEIPVPRASVVGQPGKPAFFSQSRPTTEEKLETKTSTVALSIKP